MCRLKINDDGTLYLSKCTVDGVSVRDNTTDDLYYHYGSDPERISTGYEIGSEITYAGIEFYVLKGDKNDNYVTLLKKEPLIVYEVQTYGVGHINRYTQNSQNSVYENGDYGGMAYYSSETCGYVDGNLITTGCISSYDDSDIKYVVDAWARDKLVLEDLDEVEGYKVRLARKKDINDSGCGDDGANAGCRLENWRRKYNYWTMTLYQIPQMYRVDNYTIKITFTHNAMYE